MLPTVGAETTKIVRYAAEVAGRILGISAMENLVPDAQRRAALEKAGQAVLGASQALMNAFIARAMAEHLEQRLALGKGRGVDRGFEALIANTSETIRTSLADRAAANPDYRAIFPNGTEEFMAPTIREDAELAGVLKARLGDSNLSVKNDLLASLDKIIPVVEPAAKAMLDSEKQVNALFQTELNSRKTVIDTLWEERKAVETALGRAGKGLARFVFFDFRRASDEALTEEPAGTGEGDPGTGTRSSGA